MNYAGRVARCTTPSSQWRPVITASLFTFVHCLSLHNVCLWYVCPTPAGLLVYTTRQWAHECMPPPFTTETPSELWTLFFGSFFKEHYKCFLTVLQGAKNSPVSNWQEYLIVLLGLIAIEADHFLPMMFFRTQFCCSCSARLSGLDVVHSLFVYASVKTIPPSFLTFISFVTFVFWNTYSMYFYIYISLFRCGSAFCILVLSPSVGRLDVLMHISGFDYTSITCELEKGLAISASQG